MAQGETPFDKDVECYKQAVFADSTKAAYRCQLNKFLKFCECYGLQPMPTSSQTLCRYVAFLAQTMRPSSIKQYLNVVRLMHLQNGLSNPLVGDFMLDSVLKGVQRLKGNYVKQKLPITIDILQAFIPFLNFKLSRNVTFWAACLVAFFGMLRKASLFPKNALDGHMCLKNCVMHEWGLEIICSHSKTIQCQEREAFVVLPWNTLNRDLCPVSAILKSLKLSGCCQAQEFLFTFLKDGVKYKMTYAMFTAMLKQVITSLGLSTDLYSGHSLRRGGCSLAFSAGVPTETIKAQGDWKSLAYLEYIDTSSRLERAKILQNMYD